MNQVHIISTRQGQLDLKWTLLPAYQKDYNTVSHGSVQQQKQQQKKMIKKRWEKKRLIIIQIRLEMENYYNKYERLKK